MRSSSGRAVAVVALLATLLTAAPAASGISAIRPVMVNEDWEAPIVVTNEIDATGTQGILDDDPVGLVPKTPFVQRYSLDTDHWEVWLCGAVSSGMSTVIAGLESATVDYYDAISGGLYTLSFTAGGTIPGDSNCLDGFQSGTYSTVGSPEGIFIVDDITGGGYASPGFICGGTATDCPTISSTWPGNGRYAVVGQNMVFGWPSVIAHELGHTLQWPHSFSGLSASEYDNPIDVMSGNYDRLGAAVTEANPYSTLSFNRYQSGWVSTSDVVVANGTYQSLTLQPFNVGGTQLFAVKTATDGQFYVFGARTTSSYDPIPLTWQGVEVYFVDHLCDEAFFGGICPGLWREHHQEPPNAYQLVHVLTPGESIELEGLTISVIAATTTGYTIESDPASSTEPAAPSPPTITAGNGQATVTWTEPAGGGADIVRYELEINDQTVGSTSVINTGTSLGATVTGLTNGHTYRARVRAVNAVGASAWSDWSSRVEPAEGAPPPPPPKDTFVDDDDSIFEADIEWLATADITKGCNPPASDRFCPESPVTRGQMAAFLARALELTATGTINFVDDDGSIFEDDIEKLAAAGITRGCNDTGTRFCPDANVTRGEMAAFLVRALGLTDPGTVDFTDDEQSIFEDDIEKLAAAGITRGCNDTGTEFCPDDPVTRGQMAAFLRRALG